MVDKIEQYADTLKVILKSTKKHPVGYFYCDAEDIDIVQNYSWYLSQHGKSICVVALDFYKNYYLLHRELAYKILNYYPSYIEHINGLEIDNVDKNLNVVTQQQNVYNQSTRRYSFDKEYNYFRVRIVYNRKDFFPFNRVKTEVEACQLAYLAETDFLRLKMQDNYYMYNFLLDRRNDLDILDDERTGKISQEEAVYRHVVRYAKDNAWYYFRYNLAEYFKDNHIPIPKYGVDEQGFMIHPITGQKLCPFN